MDGTLFPAESVDSFKIDKVVKHATVFPGGLYNTSFVFMMNPAKYDKMPADVKKAVDECRAKWPRAFSARAGTVWTRPLLRT
jgi:TRAP-type C4-dicarboxylate transport system substrate-binding protein